MHASSYGYEQRVTLWSVFVPQFARESVLAPGIPREIQKRLGETGYITCATSMRLPNAVPVARVVPKGQFWKFSTATAWQLLSRILAPATAFQLHFS
jgi:hypothetical protein